MPEIELETAVPYRCLLFSKLVIPVGLNSLGIHIPAQSSEAGDLGKITSSLSMLICRYSAAVLSPSIPHRKDPEAVAAAMSDRAIMRLKLVLHVQEHRRFHRNGASAGGGGRVSPTVDYRLFQKRRPARKMSRRPLTKARGYRCRACQFKWFTADFPK
jgi:hypothetical protein